MRFKFQFRSGSKGHYGGNLAGMPHCQNARERRGFVGKGKGKSVNTEARSDFAALLVLSLSLGFASMAMGNGGLISNPSLMTVAWLTVVVAAIFIPYYAGQFITRRRQARGRDSRRGPAEKERVPRHGIAMEHGSGALDELPSCQGSTADQDVVRNRKSRKEETEAGGDLGVLIVFAITFTLLPLALYDVRLIRRPTIVTGIWLAFALGATLMLWYSGRYIAKKRDARRREQERPSHATAQPARHDS